MAIGIAAKIRWAPALQSAYEHLAKGSADSVLLPHCIYVLDNKPRTSFSSQISGASQGRVTLGNLVADLIQTKILSFFPLIYSHLFDNQPLSTPISWNFLLFLPCFSYASLCMPHLVRADSHGMWEKLFVKKPLSFLHTDQNFTPDILCIQLLSKEPESCIFSLLLCCHFPWENKTQGTPRNKCKKPCIMSQTSQCCVCEEHCLWIPFPWLGVWDWWEMTHF